MPHYEYRCLDCRKRFTVFMTYAEYGQKTVSCPHCHSSAVQRRINKVRIGRSDESRLESMADPTKLAGLDEDPKSLGRMMREMSKETGEDMGPEFDEVVHRLESGQDPEQIEHDMPDLADNPGGDGGMGRMADMDLGGGGDFDLA
jgi:putative FmdB family regulatory protein